MDISSGRYTFGSGTGRLVVETGRAGLGAKAGHDLTIEVTRWRGEAVLDPADPAASSVTVEVDAESFEVRKGTGGVKPLTSTDREEIQKIIRERILRTFRFPTITFRSARAEGTAESFRLDGTLTVMDVARHVTVRGSASEGRVHGSATVTQSHWGIRPYSAFFGALRLGDDVEVRFDVSLEPAS